MSQLLGSDACHIDIYLQVHSYKHTQCLTKSLDMQSYFYQLKVQEHIQIIEVDPDALSLHSSKHLGEHLLGHRH